MDSDNETLGKRIKECRRRRNLTQIGLAKLLGVNFMTVSSWERDRYLPSYAYIVDIAGTLNVPIGYLLNGSSVTDEQKTQTKTDESKQRDNVLHYVQTPDDIFNVPILPRGWAELTQPDHISLRDRDALGFIPWSKKNFRDFDPQNPPFALLLPSMESVNISEGDIAIVNPAERPLQGSLVFIRRSFIWLTAYYFELPHKHIMIQSDSQTEIISMDTNTYKSFELIAPIVGIIRTNIRRQPLQWELSNNRAKETT